MLPLVNLIAPPDNTPVPLIVIGSAIVTGPRTSRVAPSEIVVPEAVPPSPELLVTLNTPLETVVGPL